MEEWISVKDRLPKKGNACYLGKTGTQEIQEGHLVTDLEREIIEEIDKVEYDSELWDDYSWFTHKEGHYTHWQYKIIPKPPIN